LEVARHRRMAPSLAWTFRGGEAQGSGNRAGLSRRVESLFLWTELCV
jgi:hypothetical protein